MFKSLVAASILASGLILGPVLGVAPASAQDWGDRYDRGYSQNDQYDRGPDQPGWRRYGDDDRRWNRYENADRWGWDQPRPHWRHRWHDWDREDGGDDNQSF
ncbi:hypothetical protein [Rhodoblastus sp.]|uniref:hypothetical protein n=1 Tax=Rhodoblastus sp. TaxID=1962975 RepID=UPI0035AE2D40